MKQQLLMLLFVAAILMPVRAQDYLLKETFARVNGSDESPSTLDTSLFDNPTGWSLTDAFAGDKGVILKKGGTITIPALPELTGNAAFYFSGEPWFAPDNFERDENLMPHSLSIVNGELSMDEYDMMVSMTAPCVYNAGPETRLTLTAAYDIKLTDVRIFYGASENYRKSAIYSPEPGTYYEPFDLTLSPAPFGYDMAHYFVVYTTDGSTPTHKSARYTSPIHIDRTTTIQVATVRDNGGMIIDQPQTYTIEGSAPIPNAPENTFDITVSTPGSLQQLLLGLDADIIEGLVIHGKINGEDIAYLNKGTGMMGSLSYLNLKDVTFEYDGTQYRTMVFAPAGGMGTTYVYHYILSDENYDEPLSGSPTQLNYNCYRNDLTYAFCKMDKLEHVVLPDMLKAIGPDMFSECGNLLAVTNTEHIEEIGVDAFSYCRKLSNFVLGQKLTRLNPGVFADTDLRGPMDLSGIRYIGDGAFNNTKISSVKFSPEIKYIGEGAFNHTLLKEVNLPNPPDSIPANAFDIEGLEKVVIGDGLKYIGRSAFGTNVKDITLPNSIEITAWGALPAGYIKTLTPEDGIIYVGKSAYSTSEERSTYTIKEGTKSLTDALFSWSGLESISLPGSVEIIGPETFAGTKLKITPEMPGVRRIEENAFASCFNLTKAVLPETLEYLAYNVFAYCDALWNIEFNCINLEADGFIAGKNIEKISIGPKVKKIPQGLFSENTNITAVDLPASVEIIDEMAFYRCYNLKSVNIPGQVKLLGNYAFADCHALTDVAPIDVEVISESAFADCENLECIRLSDRTKVIGSWAFASCGRLKEIHWPLGLEEIGDGAFSSCDALEVISLPEGATKIGNSAFSYCKSVKKVYIPSTLTFDTEFDSYGCFAFNNEGMNATITCMLPEPPAIRDYYWTFNDRVGLIKVPAASLDAYKQHSEWASFAGRIVSVEGIEAIAENSNTSFGTAINENTDLSDAVVGDVYVTLGNDDTFDPTDGAIVLASTMDKEYAEKIGGLAPGESDIANRFNGLVISVAAGSGTASIDCRTIGENMLTVKIGNNEPQTYTRNEKGTVDVEYNVSEPTFIYIYGSKPEAKPQQAKRETASRTADEGCVRIYSINVTNVNAGIEDVVNNAAPNSSITGYFTIDGRKVDAPSAPGVYIIRHADGTSEKVRLNNPY